VSIIETAGQCRYRVVKDIDSKRIIPLPLNVDQLSGQALRISSRMSQYPVSAKNNAAADAGSVWVPSIR
jgi:hypothetical protein